jgi:peptidoglycan/xylan/chitin deacetylase (PgdA/CDA1 family)
MQDPRLIRLGLSVLGTSRFSRLLAPICRGMGAILMLHHVVPGGGEQGGFNPNRGLEIRPEFLNSTIEHLQRRGVELISLAEAVERIRRGAVGSQPFATVTIDDGYRDALDYAVPILRRHRVPYAIFVASAIADGTCELWWRILELAIRDHDEIIAELPEGTITRPTRTLAQKRSAFLALYWPVRRMDQHVQRRWIREFAARYGIDVDGYCRSVALDWSELRSLTEDPLCTIGAHSINHFAMSRLPAREALAEMTGSADRIERELGRRPDFFAFPYGDESSAGPRDFDLAREAGFAAALTTAKGLVSQDNARSLWGLPRLSLNGDYQRLDYLDVLMSGVPFAARDIARRLLDRI